MTGRFRLKWTPTSLQRFTLALVVIGAGLTSVPAVSWMLGPNHHLGVATQMVPWVVGVSTAFWSYWLFRVLLRGRTLWHFLWLGPLFGALNAGTSLGVLMSDEGLAQGLYGFLMGCLFGIPFGGTLGLGFGAVIAVLVGYYKYLLGKEIADAALRLLSVAAAWMSVVTVLAMSFGSVPLLFDYQPEPSGTGLPAVLAHLIATAIAVWAVAAHAWSLLHMRALRSGRVARRAIVSAASLPELDLPVLAEIPSVEVIVQCQHAGSGPFRGAEAREALSYIGDYAELWRRTVLVALVAGVIVALWCI